MLPPTLSPPMVRSLPTIAFGAETERNWLDLPTLSGASARRSHRPIACVRSAVLPPLLGIRLALTCTDQSDSEVRDVCGMLELCASAFIEDGSGRRVGHCPVVDVGIRGRQGHIPDELVRAGRARRLLPGQGDRVVR